MLNNSAIIHELHIIGKRWNIPLLYEAADALDRISASYDQLWFDHNRMTAMYDYQNRRLVDLERENIALKVKIDQLYRENQGMNRKPLPMLGGRVK